MKGAERRAIVYDNDIIVDLVEQKMKLWKKACGALKDRNSIWTAKLKRSTPLHIEVAVIKATSHDQSHIDYRNARRVFAWICISPAYFTPFMSALCMRMEKTQSWVVALKGLVLMHGVFCCRLPTITVLKNIGHLPFDLSNFQDGHLNPVEACSYNALVRAYYEFLDKKSFFLCMDLQEREEIFSREEQYLPPMQEQEQEQELLRLQKLQGLLDMLLHIKPQLLLKRMNTNLILEAIDCIIIEIFDIYSRICNGVARVLVRIYSASARLKVEATMVLAVLKKATMQGTELSLYIEFCRDLGVLTASQCPKVDQVPEEDIRELELIINSNLVEQEDLDSSLRRTQNGDEGKDPKTGFNPVIITDNWEVFDEDLIKEKPLLSI